METTVFVIYVFVVLASGGVLIGGRYKYGKQQGCYGYGAGCLLTRLFHEKITQMQIANMRKLKIATRKELEKEIHYNRCKQIGIIVVFIFLCSCVAVVYCISSNEVEKVFELERDVYDGESISYELAVKTEEEEEQQISVSVDPRVYTQQEIDAFFESAFQTAWKDVLGDNMSFAQINKPLHLVEEIEENPISINWWFEDSDYVLDDGMLNYELIGEGIDTTIFLELQYKDDVRQQSQMIHLSQPVFSKREMLLQRIQEKIEKYEQKDRTQQMVVIPSEIDGTSVGLVSAKTDPGIFILGLIGIPVLLFLKGRQDMEEQLQMRQRQLVYAYPAFIQKFVLYLGAGMTLKQCFEQLYMEYTCATKEEQEKKKYLYSEIGAMVQELKSGVAEQRCYEEWGKHLQNSSYMKLVTLLVQNISKGNKDLVRILNQEVQQARKDRQEYAKKLGEEASTKMLFPMLILLMITIVIVVVPAFMNFS